MTTSGPDVARAAHAAGFPDGDLVTAVAVAYAESSFNENASHRNADGSVDYGLWQINSVHGFPELEAGTWRDPKVNAQLAYRVFKSQGWNAWSTHKPSDPVGYARFTAAIPLAETFVAAAGYLSAAAQGPGASAAGVLDSATGAAGDALTGAAAIAKEPLAVLHWLTDPRSQQRIAKVVIGAGLVVVALAIFARPAVMQATGAVGAAVAKGAV